MEVLKSQVSRARRRLNVQQFLGVLPWCLFLALVVALCGIAAPKIWILPVESQTWIASWLGGSLAAGLLASLLWTYLKRRPALDAAVEIDHRFGLKERVSSTLSLAPSELQSDAGQALMNDALRRVETLDVREQFPVRTGWRVLLPLLPAAAVSVLVLFVADATQRNANAANSSKAEMEAIKTSTDRLKKRLVQRKKNLERKGLKNADAIFKEIEKGLDKLDGKSEVDRKKALVQLKDISKKLDERRKQLGGVNQMKNQLQQLKNLEKGPADKVGEAIKQGDFKKAMQAIQDLKDKLENGKLSEQEKQELAKQLNQMKNKLQQMADAHEQMKQDLQKQIQAAKQAGDMQAAGQLQQQLDQLNQQNQMMQKMQQMANQMAKAAESLKNGNQKGAGENLKQMVAELQELQEQLDELESLDELMDEIADARDAMNCKNCNGAGCQMCQGAGMGDMPGMGMGEGQGKGERPEEETATKDYRSRVGAKPRKGEAVNIGSATGLNVSGVSKESVKEAILETVNGDADPLADQRLPRDQREHTADYFNRLRSGD